MISIQFNSKVVYVNYYIPGVERFNGVKRFWIYLPSSFDHNIDMHDDLIQKLSHVSKSGPWEWLNVAMPLLCKYFLISADSTRPRIHRHIYSLYHPRLSKCFIKANEGNLYNLQKLEKCLTRTVYLICRNCFDVQFWYLFGIVSAGYSLAINIFYHLRYKLKIIYTEGMAYWWNRDLYWYFHGRQFSNVVDKMLP